MVLLLSVQPHYIGATSVRKDQPNRLPTAYENRQCIQEFHSFVVT